MLFRVELCRLFSGDSGHLDDYRLLIFNPLTGRRKTIPNPPNSELVGCFALNMSTQSTANGSQSYYIILQDKNLRLSIYNSVTKEWKFVEIDVITLYGDIRTADVIFDAWIDFTDQRMTVLIGYNIDREEWYEEDASKPWGDEMTDEISYVRHKGQIYMVGGIASKAAPITRRRVARLAQPFIFEPGYGWGKVASLNDSEPDEEPAPCELYEDDIGLTYQGEPVHVQVKELRPQFDIPSLAATNSHIDSQWLKLLLSPPPSLVALSFYVPSFTAKP